MGRISYHRDVLPYEAGKQMSSNVHNFHELRPRIIVMGVGGAGGNAVNNMIASGLHGVEFVAANTDAQALSTSGADVRLQLGVNLTEGLGAGSNPEIGEGAAEEVMEEMKELLSEVHMIFIACGMGGGTGTGAAPVIARIAQELGVLTVAVVTKPFQFEGQRRMRIAETGIEQLRKYVDTMIVIPNQNLFRLANEQTTFADSFCLADSVLNSGVACVTDLIMKEGLINLDFADVKTVITEMGAAVMGTGVAHGEGRARKAAEEAISNPLIDDISLAGAKGLLISISGGQDMTLFEVDEVASRIRQEVDQNANIIVGATFDEQLEGYLRVSLVASGLNRGHPESMHIEADRRRMEIDAEIEQNTLGLNERLQSLETSSENNVSQTGEQRIPQNDPSLQAVNGRMRPQGPQGGPVSHAVAGAAVTGGVNEGQQRGGPSPQNASVNQADGRGNVKIVNKPPRFMSPDSDGGYSPPATPGSRDRMQGEAMTDPMTGREFVAGAPQTINRSMRRMPSMEDLPITGQNQLRAYKAPEGQFKEAEPKKKGGFFSRLTGRNRKQEEVASETSEEIVHQPSIDEYAFGDGSIHNEGQVPHQYNKPVQEAGPARDQQPSFQETEQNSYINQGGVAQGSVTQGAVVRDPHLPQRENGVLPSDQPMGAPHKPQPPSRDVVSSSDGEVRNNVPPQGAYDRHLMKKQGIPKGTADKASDKQAPKSDYDLSMEEHYKQHPSARPETIMSEHDGVNNEGRAGQEWVPSKPETPAERYPTLELNKSGVGNIPLDEEENIADIPPFLKEKRKG